MDIDGDGLLDAFFCSDLSDNLKYRNTGNGVLVPAPGLIGTETREPSDNSGNYGSVWADVDGDLELYVSKCRQVATGPSDPRRINMLFRNDGTEGFFEVGKEAGLAVSAQSWASDFEDIDNDGDLDAFVGNHGDLSHLFVNQGDGRFTRESSARGISVGVKVMQALFRDLNNDGWLDLLITGELSRFYLNRGDETFIEAENLLTGGHPESCAAGDLNRDGFIDLFTGYASLYNTPTSKPDRLWINQGNLGGEFGGSLGRMPMASALVWNRRVLGAARSAK